jgi:hypothetical protein
MKQPSARDKKRPYRPAIGSVVTWLVPAIPNTPPGLCKGFRLLAQDCLEDARKLDEFWKVNYSSGTYILIAHALELSLKAFLARQGMTEKELRKDPYRHNLDNLYCKAVELGLNLPSLPHAKGAIAWVNEYHNGGDPVRYALRYAASTRTLPAGPVMLEIIDAILLAAA